jgi:hypothetical protein
MPAAEQHPLETSLHLGGPLVCLRETAATEIQGKVAEAAVPLPDPSRVPEEAAALAVVAEGSG